MSILTALLPLPLALAATSVPMQPPAAPQAIIAPAASAPAQMAPARIEHAVARPNQAQVIRVQQPAAPAPLINRDTILDQAGRSLTSVRTAKGRFTQTNAEGTRGGQFYISRPGKIRFEFTSPEPMFIISDGVTVSIEEPRRRSYDSAPLASTPFALFLRANLDLRRDGDVVNVRSANGAHFVTLRDKTGEAQGTLELEFAAQNFELKGWTATDEAGARTRVSLANVETNVTVAPSLFVVRAPEDEDRRR
jgi:outer membrane lipoprotein-sorting protein